MSISIFAGKTNKEENMVSWVFTEDEMTPSYFKGIDDETEIPNPNYRPELDINMSNDNAWMVLNAIGILIEDSYFSVPVDEMIGRCTSYLKKRIGKQSKEIEAIVEQGETGPKIIHCGVPIGYIEQRIHQISVLAREGKARGADIIYGA